MAILNARVWTGDEARPAAEAVAVRGNRIVRVGSTAEVRRMIGPRTRVIDARGRLVAPGVNDNHTHFEAAGRLLLGLNLLDVNEPREFASRVGEVARRYVPGAWITGGDWGAYGQWQRGSAGIERSGKAPEFLPTRRLIDSVSGDHPALLSRFDRRLYLANSLALRLAGITRDTADPPNGEILRDADGEPNGLLLGAAVELVRKLIPRPSREQRLAEGRRALEELRRYGVTSIQDITSPDQLEIFEEFQRRGDLTVRVYARFTLDRWEEAARRIRERGAGNEFLRLGGLKGFVDGIMGNSTALFFRPYDHDPKNSGQLRPMMFPEGNLLRLVREADRAGLAVTVHAIGDRANRILLDTYEQVFRENGPRDRRFRVTHAQVLSPEDFARFGKLGLIAEVQPFHLSDDMRWMEERIGRERSRGAYAFRSLLRGGALVCFGSDWPGTNASLYPANPLLGLYAAVTRQTLKGEPAGGWFPEEKLTIEEALRFYSLNSAYATFEEKIKGSISEGKLADLVVLSGDLLASPPRQWLDFRVLYTVLDGKVVYAATR